MPNLITGEENNFPQNPLDSLVLRQKVEQQALHYLAPQDILLDEDFHHIFPIQENVFQAIVENMQSNGFNPHYPLLLWSQTSILLDGHTRLAAAKYLNIKQVPVIFISLNSREEAFYHIYSIQFHRRNMTCVDIIHFLGHYLKMIGQKPPYLRKKLAKILNTSEITVHKYLTLLDNQDSFAFTALMQGQITISRAYALLKKPDYKDEQKELDQWDNTDAMPYVKAYHQKINALSAQQYREFLPLLHEILTLLQMFPKQQHTVIAQLLLPLIARD